MNKSIKIAGAGISGLTAAINLAKAGYKVTVFEKRPQVGAGHQGDWEGLENWTTKKNVLEVVKDCGLEINFPYHPQYEGSLYGPNARTVTHVSDKKPIGYFIKRGSQEDTLDTALKIQAQNLGVEIKFGSPAPKDAKIIATGPKKFLAFATGFVFETTSSERTLVLLDNLLSPLAYSYIVIKNGWGTVAVCARGRTKLKNNLEQATILFQKISKFKMENKKPFAGGAYSYPTKSAFINNKLYVGEAVGFQDTFAGFGLRYAIVSGYLASESIIKNKNYDLLWKKAFEGQMKSAVVNRFFVEIATNPTYYSLILVSKLFKKNISTFLNLFYRPSFIKNLLSPLASFYWKKFVA